MPEIFYPPTLDWNFLFQRPQQILRQFSLHGWTVHYCNKTQKPGKKYEKSKEGVIIHHDYDLALKLVTKPEILYITSPLGSKHIKKVSAKTIIYDCLDYFPDYQDREKILFRNADLIFTSSKYLYQKKYSEHPDVYLVENGCQPEHFKNNKTIPERLAAIPKPRIGFSGALGFWVDSEIIKKVSENFSLVIIGKEFGKNSPDSGYFLGEVNYDDLPAYLNNFDVGIIPFRNIPTSKAASPLKLYEYLAAGLPVVSTPLPAVNDFNKIVYQSNGADNFIEDINKALVNNSQKLVKIRKEKAARYSWTKIYARITKILTHYNNYK